MDTVEGVPLPPLRDMSTAVRAELRVQAASVAADAELVRVCRGDRPIVAGPWLSEVGFEVLYWIPLLRWLAEYRGVTPERLVALTRGGAGPWYDGLAHRTIEAYDHLPAERVGDELRRRAGHGRQKQLDRGALDEELLRVAGVDHAVLHPRIMYRLFAPLWMRRRPLTLVERRTIFSPLPTRRSAAGDKPYVAVKAYFSTCLPPTPANRDFLRRLLERLAEHGRVVLLSTGLSIDEHEELAGDSRVETLAGRARARDNLAVQSDAVAGAEALFCTYGGFAHLGPFLGVPTFALYSDDAFVPAHLDVMQRAARALRADGSDASFTLLSVESALKLSSSLPNLLPEPIP